MRLRGLVALASSMAQLLCFRLAAAEELEPGEFSDSTKPSDGVEHDAPWIDARAQRPQPVALNDVPDPPARFVEVGPFFGYTLRPSEESRVTYGPATTWGLYARPELTSWLGARVYFRQESIPVTVHRGGFELPQWPLGETDFHQPNLRLRSLGARMEPTWVVNPRLRLSGIVGIAWLRFVAPKPVGQGELFVQTASRSGVELNPMLGASLSYDVVPNWLAVTLGVTHGWSVNRSGEAYRSVQAFADGQRLFIAPLPHFQSVSDILLSLGLIL